MAERFEVAENRLFKDIYICRDCNAKNKIKGSKNPVCRKCGSQDLRLKHSKFKG